MTDVDVNGNDINVPDKEFDEGPPGEERSTWDRLDDVTKAARWADWFRLGGELKTLKYARKLAKAVTKARVEAQQGTELVAYGDSSFARPVELTIDSQGQYGDIHGNNSSRAERDVTINRREFDLGPADEYGRLDDNFKSKTEEEKKDAWKKALNDNPAYELGELSPNHLIQRDLIVRVKEWMDGHPNPHLEGRLDKLVSWGENNPGKASLSGIGAVLLTLGVATGLYYLIGWLQSKSNSGNTGAPAQPSNPARPSNVELKPTTEKGKNTITVSWNISAGPQPAPTKFRVTLINEKEERLPKQTLDAMTTSIEFPDVADGTWHAEVVAVNASGESEAATSSEVTLPVPAVQTSGAPGKPTNVTGSVSFSPTSRKRGITVTWKKPTTGSEPAGYNVSMRGIKPVIPPTPSMETKATSARFEDGLQDGTFRAIVEAYNATGKSGEVESDDIVFTAKAAKAPSAPTGVEAHQFVPEGAQKASLTVIWDASDEEISAYRVTLSGNSMPKSKDEISTNGTQFDGLDEGTYSIQVFAQNTAGESQPSVTVRVTIDLKQAAKNVDWNMVITQSQIKKWTDLQNQMTKMDEDTKFWPFIIALLEDKNNEHGGVPSYEDQAILAGLLTQWIKDPKTPPKEKREGKLAGFLRDLTKPPFPDSPPATPYNGDPLVLWKEIQNLTNKMGARIPLRYRLFAVLRALEDYLGVPRP